MKRASAIDQQNPEHKHAKQGHTIHLYGPPSPPITPAPVFAVGGKPSTRLPPGDLVDQLKAPEVTEPLQDKAKQEPDKL